LLKVMVLEVGCFKSVSPHIAVRITNDAVQAFDSILDVSKSFWS